MTLLKPDPGMVMAVSVLASVPESQVEPLNVKESPIAMLLRSTALTPVNASLVGISIVTSDKSVNH